MILEVQGSTLVTVEPQERLSQSIVIAEAVFHQKTRTSKNLFVALAQIPKQDLLCSAPVVSIESRAEVLYGHGTQSRVLLRKILVRSSQFKRDSSNDHPAYILTHENAKSSCLHT